jgi:hypothetical protein
MRRGERTLKLSTATITAAQFDDVLAPFLNTEHLFARSTEYRLENSIFAPIADALDRARSGIPRSRLCVGRGRQRADSAGDRFTAAATFRVRAHAAIRRPQGCAACGSTRRQLFRPWRWPPEETALSPRWFRTTSIWSPKEATSNWWRRVRRSAFPGSRRFHQRQSHRAGGCLRATLAVSVELVAGAERRPCFVTIGT